jgi:hypothetical protein
MSAEQGPALYGVERFEQNCREYRAAISAEPVAADGIPQKTVIYAVRVDPAAARRDCKSGRYCRRGRRVERSDVAVRLAQEAVDSKVLVNPEAGNLTVRIEAGFLAHHGADGICWIEGSDSASRGAQKTVLGIARVEINPCCGAFEIDVKRQGALPAAFPAFGASNLLNDPSG